VTQGSGARSSGTSLRDRLIGGREQQRQAALDFEFAH
jgi:hypothetical protein